MIIMAVASVCSLCCTRIRTNRLNTTIKNCVECLERVDTYLDKGLGNFVSELIQQNFKNFYLCAAAMSPKLTFRKLG